MQRLVEATTRHIASHLQRKASPWMAEDKGRASCHEGKGWAVTDFNLTFPAVGVTPLGKEMPTQLLSLLVLSRATLRMVWPCKNGTRSHLSHLNIKAYSHSLRRATPALVSTSLGGFWLDSGLKLLSSYLGNISGANQLPHSCRRPKVLSRTSGRTIAPTKISVSWGCTWYGTDWSELKAAQLFANSS